MFLLTINNVSVIIEVLTVHIKEIMYMLVQTIFGMDKSKKLGDYVNALQALCEQYNVETDKIAIIEATEEYYLFLVKQEERYDVVKVETVDTNIEYYTKAYKISSFNHAAYQM
ncbi:MULTISPECIES: DUF3922 domain-containing protein [Bacillus cereus group]|uniref:DUF3922 domain-containing protein n=1 Tax=Bacillus cereus group TaxID=86661 RepID=UPI0012988FF4|nr:MULTISPECIES: DUF3922 domain-containing protein [Bacillus cereus group]MCR6788484.1 DUF3922 domain-containing protein [Bacillus thuringiensis]MCR6821830.1 DUF3922 domain-containing protein [Bacillus thuringiensis]MCR6830560.1 DUF3922 domain-containing protein [Bacillus thuringiensis]MEB8928769.1 DUF3922 domain-containing protein [Bacillus cereus]MEB9326345.1 DUF3922 domain-containing protein [Bacillus cereus]